MKKMLCPFDCMVNIQLPDYSDGNRGVSKLSARQLRVGDTVAVKKSTVAVLKKETEDKATITHLPKEYKRLATVLFVGSRFVVVKYSHVSGGIGNCISSWAETFNYDECEALCLVRRAA